MKIYSALDKQFVKYGRVLQDISFTGLVKALKEKTPLPERGFIYQASCMELEELSVSGSCRTWCSEECPCNWVTVTGGMIR